MGGKSAHLGVRLMENVTAETLSFLFLRLKNCRKQMLSSLVLLNDFNQIKYICISFIIII